MAHLRERYRYKNGKKEFVGYAAVFYDPLRHPQEKYVTLRTKDKRVAMRKKVDLEKKESLGEFDPWVDTAPQEGVLVVEAVKKYIRSREGDLRPKTVRADKSTLTCWAGSYDPKEPKEGLLPAACLLSQLEPRHIEDFLDKPKAAKEGETPKKLSPASRQTYYTRIKAFLAWCEDEGMLRHDPTKKVERPKLRRREKLFFTHAQYDRLRRAIESDAMMKKIGIVEGEKRAHVGLKKGEIRWLLDVMEIAVATGMRRTELVHMRWSWINFDAQQIVIRNDGEFTPKGKHERAIPIDDEAVAILRRWQDKCTSEADDYVFKGVKGEDQLDPTYLSKRFKKYVRLSDLPNDYTFHSLRHTFCTWMIQAGVPVPVVQELAGHADIKTTMQYLHVAGADKRDAIKQVRARRNGGVPA